MSRSNLILLGGIAAVVAGVFSLCVDALFYLLLVSRQVVPFLVPSLLTLGEIVATLLYVLGLVCLHALLGRRSGLGKTGLVMAALAFGTTLLPWAGGIPYALYQVAFLSRGTIASCGNVVPAAGRRTRGRRDGGRCRPAARGGRPCARSAAGPSCPS